MKKADIYKVLVLPDLQIPYYAVRPLKAIEQFMKDNTWDELLYLGDFLDNEAISHWIVDSLRKRENKRLKSMYRTADEILSRHIKIVRSKNPKCTVTMLQGNHEEWAEKYVDQHPELEGMIEPEIILKFKERKINFVRCYDKGDLYNIGNAYFHHGLYTNKYHAFKHVDTFGVNIYYGHVNDFQSFQKIVYGKNKMLEAQALGCLCIQDMPFIKGRPTNWIHGFAVFYFYPDGYYTHYPVKIFKNRFVWNGKHYGYGTL
jgi:hypothetical protein